MSDDSVYYSPGEVDNDDTKVVRSLLSDFQDETKSTTKVEPEREPMKVFLRIRPFTPEEIKTKHNQSCLKVIDGKSIHLEAPADSFTFKSSIRGIAEQTHQFSFSKVYDEAINQKAFFDDAILGCVKDFLDGINCLVFTYGVTNSGKTFTIQGSPKNGGILPRTLDVLFNSTKGKQYEQINLKPTMYQDVAKLTKDQQKYEEVLKSAILNAGQKENMDLSILWKMDTTTSSDTSTISTTSTTSNSTYVTANEPDYSSIAEEIKERVCDGTVIDVKSQGPVKFCIWVSFAEIYNEYVYDLLDPTPAGKGKKRPVLKLCGDKKGNPFIKGLKHIQVNSADEAFKVLRVGQKNQNIAITKLNQNSSRSHSIFTIKVLRVVDVEDPHVVRISRLSFVDLAGSERYCKTQSTGDRLKEASNINTSIMTLGKCIEYLRYNQLHKNHPLIIPFRENKLTRLFQGFFLGKGKACMIVNVSPCASIFDETFNVLKFSAVAKQVTTKTSRNTEIFKPKKIPKPSLSTLIPSSKIDRSNNHWLNGGLTTPRHVQKDVLSESLCDYNDERFQALMKSYEDMRKQLIEERRKNAIMELKIREEVCTEMSEQIVEIEKNYSDRLQEEQQCLEEQCDKRIEMLTKSIKKSRKRKKIDRIETEDDSSVSSILHQAEKCKVKDRDDTILALRAKLAEKEVSHEFYKQAHTPEQHSQVISSLQSQLEEATETLKFHEVHIEELTTTLTSAKDAVEEKEIEIEKLKEVVVVFEESTGSQEMLELQTLLETTSRALNEARIKLDTRDEKLKDRNEKIRLLEQQLADKPASSIADIDQFEKDLARFEEQTKMLHERSEFQSEETKQLRLDNEKSEGEKRMISDKVDELKRQLLESEERREQLQFRDEEMKGKLRRYEGVIQNHETALTESENIIEQLNANIKDLSDEVRDLKEEEDEISFKSIDNGVSVSKSTKENVDVQEQREMIEEIEARLREYEKLIEQLRRDNLQVKELQENVEGYRQRVDKYEEMLDSKEKHFTKALEELKTKVECLTTENLKIPDLEESLRSTEAKSEEQLNDFMMKEEELKREIDGLEKVACSLRNEMERAKDKLEEVEKVSVMLKGETEKKAEELKQEKTGIKSGLGPLTQGCSKLKTDIIRSSVASPRSPMKTNHVKELEKTLNETTRVLDKKNEQVILKNNKIKDLKKNLDLQIQANETLKGSINEQKEKARMLLEESKLQIRTLEENVFKEGAARVGVEEELTTVKVMFEAKFEAVRNLENAVSEAESKVDGYEEAINENKKTIAVLQDQSSSLEEKITSMVQDMNEKNVVLAEAGSLKERLESSSQTEIALISQIASLESGNEKLQQNVSNSDKKLTDIETSLKTESIALNIAVAELKSRNESLEQELVSYKNELGSRITDLNAFIEERITLETERCRNGDVIADLQFQIKLKKDKHELNTVQIQDEAAEAAKKQSALLYQIEKKVAERNKTVESQKCVLQQKQERINELEQKLEKTELAAKDNQLVKDNLLLHELRCSVMEKEAQLTSTRKDHSEQLDEIEKLKLANGKLTAKFNKLKKSLEDRENQILKARQEVENLQHTIEKLQRERDDAVRASQSSSTNETSSVFEEDNCSSAKKQKRKTPARKALLEVNKKLEVLEADTPGSPKDVSTKPKRRRKLLSKNTSIFGDSPQVIPRSPTSSADQVNAIVKRQLRSATRK